MQHPRNDAPTDSTSKTAEQVAADLRQSFARRGFNIEAYDDGEIINAVSQSLTTDPINYVSDAFERLQKRHRA